MMKKSGWSSTSLISVHCTEIDALVKEKRQITVSKIALKMTINYGLEFVIVCDVLGYHKVYAGWVLQ
jgi:plasmid maintenance system antidote protein VapI